MLKITQFHDTDKPDPKHLLLAIDVSSKRLDLYTKYRQQGSDFELADSFLNELPTIEERTEYYHRHARILGYSGLSFVVEPSGCFENKLAQLALQQGHSVWTVNPERIYRCAG